MPGRRRPAAQSRHGCSALRLALVDRVRVRLEALRVEAELDRDPPTCGGEVDDRAGAVVAAVVEDVPLEAGRVEGDRLAAAEHEQPVSERLQPGRHLAELGPRRELEPRGAAPGEHPDEGRAAASSADPPAAGVFPFGSPPSSQSVTVTPDQRVSTLIVLGR